MTKYAWLIKLTGSKKHVMHPEAGFQPNKFHLVSRFGNSYNVL